jgi:hypothetical protein
MFIISKKPMQHCCIGFLLFSYWEFDIARNANKSAWEEWLCTLAIG